MIEVENIGRHFGEIKAVDGISFEAKKGEVLGFLGPNGAGKTTLFKLITGLEKPDTGEFKTGETAVLGYMEQSREVLDSDKTVFDVISGGLDLVEVGKQQVNARAYTARFNFNGSDQQKKVNELSGGES